MGFLMSPIPKRNLTLKTTPSTFIYLKYVHYHTYVQAVSNNTNTISHRVSTPYSLRVKVVYFSSVFWGLQPTTVHRPQYCFKVETRRMSDPKYAYPYSYPYPAQGYYQGPPVMAPPQYYAPPPQRHTGFLEGCLAALCCCCLIDDCCCDPSIIFIS